MKVLAALATLAMATAIGANAPQAADKTARLSDPAISGHPQVTLPRAVETAPSPISIGRTGLSQVELDRIHAAIREHIHAITAQRAQDAFKTLSPLVQDHYRDSGGFLSAISNDLKPVATARSFAFTTIDREAQDALQSVTLTDAHGRKWLAEYRLQRQGDGSWAILGCLVEPLAGQQA